MTYIVKTLSTGTGVYDTVRGCFPIAGDELRKAGITRIEGTGPNGWFKKSETDAAQAIADTLNTYYSLGEFVSSKVSKSKAKAPVEDDSAMTDMAAALVSDQA